MSNDMIRVPPQGMTRGTTIDANDLDSVARLAKIAVDSGLVSVRKPEEAIVILLTGRELGLAPMQSLRGIYVVNGKPVLSADLLVAVVRRSGLCESWQVDESTAERCTITTKRVGEPKPTTKTWTMADAKRAGVAGKPIWQQYPAQMLRHRCAADLARECYSDVALGLYDPEEVEGVPRDEVRGTAYSVAPEIQRLDNVTGTTPRVTAATVREAFDRALADATCLANVAAVWQKHSAALHAQGVEDAAFGEVSRWLAAGHYDLTDTERHGLLTATWPEVLTVYLDDLSAQKTPEAVHAFWRANKTTVETFGEPHRGVARLNTVRAVMRLRGCSLDAAKRYLASDLSTPPDNDPPTGTDSPRSARNAPATGDATSAPVESAPGAAGAPAACDVDAPGVRSAGGDDLSTREARRAHLSTKHHTRAVEASYAAHSGLPSYLDDCTARMCEIVLPDGTTLHAVTARKRLVDARNAALRKQVDAAKPKTIETRRAA